MKTQNLQKRTIIDYFIFILVSIYLLFAGLFLIVTGKLINRTLLRKLLLMIYISLIKLFTKQGQFGRIRAIKHESGYCYTALILFNLMDFSSQVYLCENDIPLGQSNSLLDDVRMIGRGRYRHWQGYILYFSASDNSDPRSNGRTYSFRYSAK